MFVKVQSKFCGYCIRTEKTDEKVTISAKHLPTLTINKHLQLLSCIKLHVAAFTSSSANVQKKTHLTSLKS